MKQPLQRLADSEGSRWYASLALTLEPRNGICRLTRNTHEGPLYVQKPFYPEGLDLAHIYLLHPPGGLVSGDQLRIDVILKSEAKALLTTPGAGRVYRARPDQELQQQAVFLNAEVGGSIEWLPQETIVFPGAHGSLDMQVNLAANSQFIGWEITSLGLPTSGRQFDCGSIRQRIRIHRGGSPVLIEHFLLDDASRALYPASAGLQSRPVNGIFMAGSVAPMNSASLGGDCTREALESRLQAIAGTALSRGMAGVTFVNGFVIARYLGDCSEEAKNLFIRLWEVCRPLVIGRPVSPPRIWAT